MKMYKCRLCDKIILGCYKTHTLTHIELTGKCPICEIEYPNVRSLIQHINRKKDKKHQALLYLLTGGRTAKKDRTPNFNAFMEMYYEEVSVEVYKRWLKAKLISCTETIKYYRNKIQEAHHQGNPDIAKKYIQLLKQKLKERNKYKSELMTINKIT